MMFQDFALNAMKLVWSACMIFRNKPTEEASANNASQSKMIYLYHLVYAADAFKFKTKYNSKE